MSGNRWGGPFRAARRHAVLIASTWLVACGKEGPPLPPLVRLPAAPATFTAERRGDAVEIRFVVPSANTDGTRPANVEQVDVYAMTGPSAFTDDELIDLGSRVGSIGVEPPRDPEAPPGSDRGAGRPPGDTRGVDQGALASLAETLTPGAYVPVNLTPQPSGATDTHRVAPLSGPPMFPLARTYTGVGVTARGRRGPFSARVGVPLAPVPRPPAAPTITYDEKAITVAWQGLQARAPMQEPASGEILPATIVGLTLPTTGYNVYEVPTRRPRPDAQPQASAPSASSLSAAETKLTAAPIAETRYSDSRVEWGLERCYTVRVAQAYGAAALESEPSPVSCVTPADTFAPAAPANVQAVPSEGAVSLAWQRGEEPDVAGFIVLRARPSETLAPVTASPIPETSFTDKVAPGVAYVYAVQAVDKAGNVSALSSLTEAVEAR